MAETPSKRPREQSEEKNLERAEGDQSEDAKRHQWSRYLHILATFLLEEPADDLAAGTTSPADDLSSLIATLQRELSDSDSVPPPTEPEDRRPSQVRVDGLIEVRRDELGIPNWAAESESEEERVVEEYEEVAGPGFGRWNAWTVYTAAVLHAEDSDKKN